MRTYQRFLLIVAGLLTSCTDVIDVDLNTAEPRLVIDAGIQWIKGSDGNLQTIRLSTTTDYYAPEVPPVSDAVVYITNNSGMAFDFVEGSEAGKYTCTDFVPEIGETYELTVIVDGQTYTATETLMGSPEVARITQEDEGGLFGEEIEVWFYFPDDGVGDNFYHAKIETNFLPLPEHFVLDNSFMQGNEMFLWFNHEDMEAGHIISLELSGISERFYRYMTLILEAQDGNPFAPPPGNIRGNIINTTDRDNHALGYFRLSETDKVLYRVE